MEIRGNRSRKCLNGLGACECGSHLHPDFLPPDSLQGPSATSLAPCDYIDMILFLLPVKSNEA